MFKESQWVISARLPALRTLPHIKQMIKEIFDIEPVQKNALIVFLCIFCLSFLQIYLFKDELLDKGAFQVIGFSLGLSVCWLVSSLLPVVLFVKALEDEEDRKNGLIMDRVVMICGLLVLGWIIILTYVAFELNLSFKNFIRGSILTIILRSIFWLIYGLIVKRKRQER